ncbi:MBL fold metallo-hydrolase [Haloferax namakaokahaiae]|uniref:MBL fold metallo-hydrolase n=1 Tax=Haloferax namakaokahaiae TaxID=1748331 RepID=A0ABD5ZK01_9EURY
MFASNPVQLNPTLSEPIHLTWWGAGTWEIDIDGITIAVDPYLNPTSGVDYALVTHEHNDHCHAPTLRTLLDDGLEELIVSRPCLFDSEHWFASPELPLLDEFDPTVLFPKYYQKTMIGGERNDKPKWQESTGPTQVPSEIEFGPVRITAVEAPGEEPNISAPHEIIGPVANLAYLIEDTRNDFTILALGDIRTPYPEMLEFADEVDMVLYPLGKPLSRHDDPLEYQIKTDMLFLDLLQPDYLIPGHYRHEGDYPVPKAYDETDTDEYKFLIGHGFPTVENPNRYIEKLRDTIAETPSVQTETFPIRAGKQYTIE